MLFDSVVLMGKRDETGLKSLVIWQSAFSNLSPVNAESGGRDMQRQGESKEQGPFVVEIPMKNLWPENEPNGAGGTGREEGGERQQIFPAQEHKSVGMCTARKANGTACGFKAVPGKSMCARHDRWYRTLTEYLGMPYPEDAIGLQDVLAQVVLMVVAREIDAERARVLAQLCQVMQRNLRDYQREVTRAETDEQRWTRVQ
jgi:hypothetical protein